MVFSWSAWSTASGSIIVLSSFCSFKSWYLFFFLLFLRQNWSCLFLLSSQSSLWICGVRFQSPNYDVLYSLFMVIILWPVVLTSTVRSLQEGSQPTAIVSPLVRGTPPQTPSTPSSLPKEAKPGLRSSRGSPSPQSSPSLQASVEGGVDTRTSVRNSEGSQETSLITSTSSQSNSGSSGSSSFAQTSVKSKNRNTEIKTSSAMPLVGKSKDKDKNEFDCKY